MVPVHRGGKGAHTFKKNSTYFSIYAPTCSIIAHRPIYLHFACLRTITEIDIGEYFFDAFCQHRNPKEIHMESNHFDTTNKSRHMSRQILAEKAALEHSASHTIIQRMLFYDDLTAKPICPHPSSLFNHNNGHSRPISVGYVAIYPSRNCIERILHLESRIAVSMSSINVGNAYQR